MVKKRAFNEERVLHSKDFGPTGIIEHPDEVNLLASFCTLGLLARMRVYKIIRLCVQVHASP